MTSTEYLWTDDELQPHEIQSVFEDTTLSFVIISKHIDQTLTNYVKYMEPWMQYPWNFKRPEYQALTFNVVEYIYGEINYHEHVLDMELFIAILLDFTKYEDCYIHVFDSVTLEPVLATCHDALDEELQDVTTSRNRVWLHDGGCIELTRGGHGGYLSLQDAIKQIFVGDYKQNSNLAAALKDVCNLTAGLSHVHDVNLNLPAPVAKLATTDPMMISKSLEALEDEEEVKPLYLDGGIDVTVPINSVHFGVLLGIASALGKPQDLSGIVLSGLQKYYQGKEEPKVPDTMKPSSRMVLQEELISRGIISNPVPENTELVEMIANINGPKMEDEQEYAKNLQQVFEEGLDDFEDIIDEDEDEADEESDLTDDELNEFRWKYYDIASEWIPREQVAQKYQEFKSSVLQSTSKFKDEFKNTEFEDFPEFMESEIILEMSGNKYNNDSDYQSDTPDTYQGDMAYDEYVEFKNKLRQEGAHFSEEEPEENDADWESVDGDGNDDDSDELLSDSNVDISNKYEQRPTIETLYEEQPLEYEGLDPKLSKKEIERLTTTMETLKTSEDNNLESKMKK
ncbi:hypothetical protein CANMA_004754 [Candida margitis]|uniref:uncharacterized protein n=1 Tax=Candida margitis TaxID=1775924 RepID=UPI002225DA1B|nr:uncharacterized protein CANMA_004754 [Candida margitis]KAI5953915.1 hypothetical protein CANMA_004754 [Candida margitis]